MTACVHQQVPCTHQNIISLGSRFIACCKLAPTLARQMWRHNYVIDRNEYLIFTVSESINPWVYLQQFLFKSTNNSWRYERKCEWVFFFEHSVYHTDLLLLSGENISLKFLVKLQFNQSVNQSTNQLIRVILSHISKILSCWLTRNVF